MLVAFCTSQWCVYNLEMMKLSIVGFCLLSIDAITCALAVISCTGTILLSSRSGSSAAVQQKTSLLVPEECVVIDLTLKYYKFYSIVQCGQGCKTSLSLWCFTCRDLQLICDLQQI